MKTLIAIAVLAALTACATPIDHGKTAPPNIVPVWQRTEHIPIIDPSASKVPNGAVLIGAPENGHPGEAR